MIFTGNHNRRRAAQNGQNNAQRRRSSNLDGRGKNSSRLSRDNSRESPSRSCYLPGHSPSSSSSSYYSTAGTSSSYHSTYMTIPELDENKHDFYLQKSRARDITKRRGAIKLIQRLTYAFLLSR